LVLTVIAMNTKYYQLLSNRYMNDVPAESLPEGELA
jgi:hypothetical protein